jgi:hypothetical protein
MFRVLGAVAVLLAVAPVAWASRTLETIDVPAKRADNATSARFDTKLKKGRLYAVRFSGSYELEGRSWDPAYCFGGGEDCAEPSPSVVAVLQHWRRVRGSEPRYARTVGFFDAYGDDDYPAYRSDHTYTLPFEALFHTQLRSSACPFTTCDGEGSFRAQLVQRPFPEGFLHLWAEDCRDGERYDRAITFSAGKCEHALLSGESGPRPGGALRLQRKRERWRDIGSAAVRSGEFPAARLRLRDGRGTERYRVVVRNRSGIVAKSNTVTIDWLG